MAKGSGVISFVPFRDLLHLSSIDIQTPDPGAPTWGGSVFFNTTGGGRRLRDEKK
jgi:hypothetical protein